MNPSELAGKLDVQVKWQDGVIQQVNISSSRPQKVTELFCGKKLNDAIELIPMLYSLCGVSQKIAAIRAAESSLGIQVSDHVEDARGLLVFAETARELSLRLFSDWLTDDSNIKVKTIKWFRSQRRPSVLRLLHQLSRRSGERGHCRRRGHCADPAGRGRRGAGDDRTNQGAL